MGRVFCPNGGLYKVLTQQPTEREEDAENIQREETV
jgi:hypothetical protein